MLSFLRLFGVTVAAVWFGAAVFFGFFVGPTFFTPEMKLLIPPPYNGAVAELVLHRYFYLHYLCGGLALAHLIADWVYSGKTLSRVGLGLVGGVLGLSLLGGLVLQPKLNDYQKTKFADHYRLVRTAAEREAATKSFRLWHGISRGMELVMLGALWLHLARSVNVGEPPRFVASVNKFGLDRRS